MSYSGERPDTAAAWAEIDGGGLVQVIVESLNPLAFKVFMNGHSVAAVESVYVAVGDPAATGKPVTALLNRFVTDLEGKQATQSQSLFPAVVDVVGSGRRFVLACSDPEQPLENFWVSLGVRPDGSATPVQGVAFVELFLASNGIAQATLTWTDGAKEELFKRTTA
jgi:hypothetical protein